MVVVIWLCDANSNELDRRGYDWLVVKMLLAYIYSSSTVVKGRLVAG